MTNSEMTLRAGWVDDRWGARVKIGEWGVPMVTCLQINSLNTRLVPAIRADGLSCQWPALIPTQELPYLIMPGPARQHLQVATLSRGAQPSNISLSPTCPAPGSPAHVMVAMCPNYQVIMARCPRWCHTTSLVHPRIGGQLSGFTWIITEFGPLVGAGGRNSIGLESIGTH